jgi:hypothetical protein
MDYTPAQAAEDARSDLMAAIHKHEACIHEAFRALASCEASHYRATLRPGTVAEILGHLDMALAIIADVREGRA